MDKIQDYIFTYRSGQIADVSARTAELIAREGVVSFLRASKSLKVVGVYQEPNFEETDKKMANAARDEDDAQAEKDSAMILGITGMREIAHRNLVSVIYNPELITSDSINWAISKHAPTRRVLCAPYSKIPAYEEKLGQVNYVFKVQSTDAALKGMHPGDVREKLRALTAARNVLKGALEKYGLTRNESVALLNLQKLIEENEKAKDKGGFFIPDEAIQQFLTANGLK